MFKSRADVKVHMHPGTELILLLKGSCDIEVCSTTLHGSPGTLFIIPENMDHNQLNTGMVETIFATFRTKYFNHAPRTIQIDKNDMITVWLKQICNLSCQTESDNTNTIQGILYAIIQHITVLEQVKDSRKRYPANLVKALKFIENNSDKAISLNTLAKHACISPSYLTLLFKKYTGLSPIEFSINTKMKLATYLLHDPYLSIKQITIRCGYNDTNYFCRLFRKHHGCTAREYRKQI